MRLALELAFYVLPKGGVVILIHPAAKPLFQLLGFGMDTTLSNIGMHDWGVVMLRGEFFVQSRRL